MLILGGTGFIGRNLVEFFSTNSNFELTATYNSRAPYPAKGVNWKKVDLTRVNEVESLGGEYDFVIQAAATTSGINDGVNNPDFHVTDNVVMNSLILRHFSRTDVRHFVFFSCTTMLQSSAIPQKESDFDANLEMFSTYFGVGWTKVYIEKLCEFYANRFRKCKYTIIRHSNIFGPHDKYDLQRSHVFAATLVKLLNSSSSITVWGNGKVKRDLLHVSDLIQLVEKALMFQNSHFRIYNCGGHIFTSVNDLIVRMRDILGKKDLIVNHDDSKPNVTFEVVLDCSLAKSELGWEPKVSLDDGIRDCVAFLKNMGIQGGA
jgi:nucleoside-diphosphate-sugar epimerase